MKKILYLVSVLFIFLLVITEGSAYVPFTNIEGVRFKIYDKSVDIEECREVLSKIDQKYYNDLSYIKILSKSRNTLGLYWWNSKSINMLGNCEKDVLIHELAHHCQYKKGDKLYNGIGHSGNFNNCEDEIWLNY
jgi:hypothetical protein